MNFKKTKVKKIRRTRKYIKKKKKTNFLKNFILYWLLGFLFISLIWTWVIYEKYIRPLPPIETLGEFTQPEASIIYDKDGKELYTLYTSEKRTFVPYEAMSKHIIHWIIAIEDQTFFENEWIDFKWIFRAVFNKVTWKADTIKWTSTISQQLIKNVFLSNERSYERKIKEAYLSYQMNKKYSKEKILELYLNKLWYWSNAFGIEQATKTFFGKSAKDVSVLEASIVTSIPKGPTYYSPYNHYDRLVWYPYKYHSKSPDEKEKIITPKEYAENKEIYNKFMELFDWLKAKRISETELILCWIDKNAYKKPQNLDDSCLVLPYNNLVNFLNDIKIKWTDLGDKEEFADLTVEYEAGRKDSVLWRMLADNYITFSEYITAIKEGFWYEFKVYKENIKYPHFVFYVREYLENKYWKEFIDKWWLKIYTSIDKDLQDKAEEIVKTQMEKNKTKFEVHNAWVISIDNKTGQILTMIWSGDYYDDEHDGQVNVITRQRQPGSSFKPIVYALWLKNSKVWSKTPIYDLKTDFWANYKPDNFDGKFMWRMNLTNALNNSRNIPAIKMFFMAWGETNIVNFAKSLWIESLKHGKGYWAPLALWTWEATPLEMAQAYSVFANMWYKKEITPIVKIVDSRWNVIEKYRQTSGKLVIEPALAYIMNSMLSSTGDRPAFWNNYLSLNGRQAAAKTWTSNKVDTKGRPDKDGKKPILPRDLWTVGYTPQITTVVWSGNINGQWANKKWNGLEASGPIWKNFMEEAHKKLPKLKWTNTAWAKSASISSISWLLAPENYNSSFVNTSLYMPWNAPTSYDNSLKQVKVDALCNGIVTDDTPSWAIKTGYYVKFRTIDPSKTKWNEALTEWINSGKAQEDFKDFSNIITKYNYESCSRSATAVSNAKINLSTNVAQQYLFTKWKNYIELSYDSYNSLKEINIYISGQLLKKISNPGKAGVKTEYIEIPESLSGKTVFKIEAIDNIYFTKTINKTVGILGKDITPPTITITNPVDGDKAIYPDQYFNLRAKISDSSEIRSVNIYLNGKPLKLWLKTRDLVFPINEDKKLEVWEYDLKVEALDYSFNRWSKTIKLKVIAK